MRYSFLLLALAGCALAEADDPTAACADIAITELPAVQFAEMPTITVAMPKRLIEVSIMGRTSESGVYTEGRCDQVVSDGNDGGAYATDYSACCPPEWHFLAVNGEGDAICEED